MRKWLENFFGRDLNTFIRFAAVGSLWTLINIASDIMLIDRFEFPAFLGAFLGYLMLYIGRFYGYLILNVVRPKFWKYLGSTLIFTVCMLFIKIVAMDVMNYPAAVASPVVTVFGFVTKYFFYKRIDLLTRSKQEEN